MRRVLFGFVLVLVLVGAAGDAVMGVLKGSGTCRVVKVIDGDTVTLWCLGDGATRARLVGFDTPEAFSPGCFSERFQGLRATYALKGALWVAGRIGIAVGGRDRYGRVLVKMDLDGKPVADMMISRGLARAYDGGQRSDWCGQ